MTLRMERRDTRTSGPRTHSACDGPGAVAVVRTTFPRSSAARLVERYAHLCGSAARARGQPLGDEHAALEELCQWVGRVAPLLQVCHRLLPDADRRGAWAAPLPARVEEAAAALSAVAEHARHIGRQRPARAEEPLEAKPLKGAIKMEVDLEIGAAAERASPARRPARTHPRQHICEPDRQVVEPDLAGARRCRRPSTDAEAELRHVGLHAQAERLDLHLQRDCVELDQPRALVRPDVRRERAEHLADRVADLVELILDRVPPFVGALVSAAEQLCLAELDVGVAEVVPHDLHRSEPPVLAAFARRGRQRSVETLHVLTHHPTEHGCVEAAEIVAVELIRRRRWRRRR
mmetsp:Transcript_41155/g.133409  ORF Transcript_41155/g.133409 Transcript_41155/m.133409 type:complete len:348 (-) Transcript_41155:316-1359(-)